MNEKGEPKKPKLEPLSAFVRLTPEQNESHDWDGADGIAVALGEPSGGLGCIDVDHPGLADYLESRLLLTVNPPLMVRTPRGLHIFTSGTPTLPRDYAVRYPGLPASKYCLVQLLSGGCYAVVPPTAGYRWLNKGAEPAYGTTDEVWHRLARASNCPYTRAQTWHFQPRERERSSRISTRHIREGMRL